MKKVHVNIGPIGHIDMVLPGDNASIGVHLDKPVALERGGRFAIREGGKTIGSVIITEVVD